MSINENCTIYVKCIEGINNLKFEISKDCKIQILKQQIKNQLPKQIHSKMNISSIGGINISRFNTLKDLYYFITKDYEIKNIPMYLDLKINIFLNGGKGGFGQLLKVKGHQMNKKNKKLKKLQKSNLNDLYKTLDGKKVKNIKKLNQIDKYINSINIKKSILIEKRIKLKKILDLNLEKNIKFKDVEFLEDVEKQIEEIREGFNISNDDDKKASSSKQLISSKVDFLNFFEPEKETKCVL